LKLVVQLVVKPQVADRLSSFLGLGYRRFRSLGVRVDPIEL